MFESLGGNIEQNWLNLKNGNHIIGLFQGMFEGNMLTFNPGWGHDAKELESFMDVHDIRKQLIEQGIQLIEDVDESNKEGPAHIMLFDPNGNKILIDQQR